MKKLFALIVLFVFASGDFSAQNPEKKKPKTFVIVKHAFTLTENDKTIIESQDFDKYRYYSQRKQIQLQRGPLIELLSVKELIEMGIAVDASLIQESKDRNPTALHTLILLLDIGLGIEKADQPK
jgi:hypothetical protein